MTENVKAPRPKYFGTKPEKIEAGLYRIWAVDENGERRGYIGQIQRHRGGWRYRLYEVQEWTYGPKTFDAAYSALLAADGLAGGTES